LGGIRIVKLAPATQKASLKLPRSMSKRKRVMLLNILDISNGLGTSVLMLRCVKDECPNKITVI
jgi:hypothetical protein